MDTDVLLKDSLLYNSQSETPLSVMDFWSNV